MYRNRTGRKPSFQDGPVPGNIRTKCGCVQRCNINVLEEFLLDGNLRALSGEEPVWNTLTFASYLTLQANLKYPSRMRL